MLLQQGHGGEFVVGAARVHTHTHTHAHTHGMAVVCRFFVGKNEGGGVALCCYVQ